MDLNRTPVASMDLNMRFSGETSVTSTDFPPPPEATSAPEISSTTPDPNRCSDDNISEFSEDSPEQKKKVLKKRILKKVKKVATKPKPVKAKGFRGFGPGQSKGTGPKSKKAEFKARHTFNYAEKPKPKVKLRKLSKLSEDQRSELQSLNRRSEVLRRKLERLREHRDGVYATKGSKHFVVRKLNKRAETLSKQLAKISIRRHRVRSGAILAW